MTANASYDRKGYPVNWISVGRDAARVAEMLPPGYWQRVRQTGYVEVQAAPDHVSEGLGWLPHGGASLAISPRINDMINTSRALIPHQDSLHSLLNNSKLNVILSFLGETFPSGITPGITRTSIDEGAVTVNIMSSPRQDEGRLHFNQSRHAKNEIQSVADAMCIIPLDLLSEYLAPHVFMSMMKKSVFTVFSRAMRGILDLMTNPGFRAPNAREITNFFRMADNILFSYAQLESNDDVQNINAVRFALKNPLDSSRKFDEAEQILVSVCTGSEPRSADFFLKIGKVCRDIIGSNVDIILGCFDSQLPQEEPWIAIYGRGVRDKRNDGFDFPELRQDTEKAAPRLPAYYRRHFGQVKGRFH